MISDTVISDTVISVTVISVTVISVTVINYSHLPNRYTFFNVNFFIDIHIEYSEGNNWLRDEFHVTNFFSIKLICISIAERGKHIFYSYLVYTIVDEIEKWIYFRGHFQKKKREREREKRVKKNHFRKTLKISVIIMIT